MYDLYPSVFSPTYEKRLGSCLVNTRFKLSPWRCRGRPIYDDWMVCKFHGLVNGLCGPPGIGCASCCVTDLFIPGLSVSDMDYFIFTRLLWRVRAGLIFMCWTIWTLNEELTLKCYFTCLNNYICYLQNERGAIDFFMHPLNYT